MKKRIKRKHYNRFKRSFLRHREWEYARMMSNKLLSNGFIPKCRNLHRVVEYAWQHGIIYGSCWRK